MAVGQTQTSPQPAGLGSLSVHSDPRRASMPPAPVATRPPSCAPRRAPAFAYTPLPARLARRRKLEPHTQQAQPDKAITSSNTSLILLDRRNAIFRILPRAASLMDFNS